MKKIFILILFGLVSCHFPWDAPMNVDKPATQFLNAIRKGDITLAKSFCTKDASNFIDSCLRNSIIIKVDEMKDIQCRVKEDTAICSFCCLSDSLNNRFNMVKKGDKWLVDDLSSIFSKK